MLKWVLPLDYQRTFDVLTESLYKKVTLEKVTVAQTRELVEYRTRMAPNFTSLTTHLYPFDVIQLTTGATNKVNSSSAKGTKQ